MKIHLNLWLSWKWSEIVRFQETEPQKALEFTSSSKVLERVGGKVKNSWFYVKSRIFSNFLFFMVFHENSWKSWFPAPQRLPASVTYIILVISYVSTSSARSEFAFFMEIPKNLNRGPKILIPLHMRSFWFHPTFRISNPSVNRPKRCVRGRPFDIWIHVV